MTKCECGLNYMSGIDEDEKIHKKWHDEYLYGPSLLDINNLHPFCLVSDYPFIVVDSSVSEDIRFQLSKAALVAQRTTPDYKTGYDGTISEADEKFFLARDNNRAIGMVLTAKEEAYWKLKWTPENTLKLVDKKQHIKPRYKIGRVWVAKAYRRTGIASLMIKAVVDFLGYEIEDIGWELPLTKDGAALLQKLAPLKWWGRGDAFTLRDTLNTSYPKH